MRRLILSAALLMASAAFTQARAQETAAPPPAESAAPAAPAEPAPAPESAAPAEAGRVAAPPAGKGQVVFFRQSKLAGAALSFSVHEGDKGVGKLGNGSFFVQVCDPGTHTFTIQSEAKDSLTLEVEAGETYYVKQTIGMGIMMGRPHLSPATKADFEGSKVKLSTRKPSDIKPAGQTTS